MRHAQKTAKPATAESNPLYVVKRSKIHGRGVYAARRIRSGTRIIEYVGDRISHEEADSRYEMKADDDGHTFLFVVDDDLCIDAGVGGNPARFINHKCDANCETIIEGRRVFIEAIRTIQPGEELGYDYQLTWESTDDPDELALYNCRCGAANCRGTMLDRESIDAKKKKEKRAAAKKKAVDQGQETRRETQAGLRIAMPLVSIIVATDERGAIGRDGGLPWRLPDDLKRFKSLTMGKPIVMGRKTWDSIGKPLPGRHNIVITRQAGVCSARRHRRRVPRRRVAAAGDVPEVCIIGGAEIYRLALPRADLIHLTRVHAVVDADTYFPELGAGEWDEVQVEQHAADEKHVYAYSCLELQRRHTAS